jgi:hypothetical protein
MYVYFKYNVMRLELLNLEFKTEFIKMIMVYYLMAIIHAYMYIS